MKKKRKKKRFKKGGVRRVPKIQQEEMANADERKNMDGLIQFINHLPASNQL